MPRVVHMMVGVMALWAIGSAPAAAFQEVPTTPAPSLTAPQFTGQALTFDEEQRGNHPGTSKSKGKGKLPGIGALGLSPKMNFGLELLYGAPEEQEIAAPSFSESVTDDVKLLGKIKRRF